MSVFFVIVLNLVFLMKDGSYFFFERLVVCMYVFCVVSEVFEVWFIYVVFLLRNLFSFVLMLFVVEVDCCVGKLF